MLGNVFDFPDLSSERHHVRRLLDELKRGRLVQTISHKAEGAIPIDCHERAGVWVCRRTWLLAGGEVTLSEGVQNASLAANRRGDSLVVATVDIDNGRFTSRGTFTGEWLGGIRWLSDGNIMFDFRETQGSYAVYTIRPGGATRRLGAGPYTEEMSSVSKDGMHMAGFNFTVKNDAYMISNFGKLLPR